MKERCATIYEKNMKAFDIIEHLIACYNNDEDKCSTMEACNSCEHSATLEEITEALEVAISALKKQEADRWIPISEALPEEEGLYLVAVKNDHDRRYSKTAWFYRGAWSLARQNVLAWRPLPEAYTEEDNDKP